MMRSWLALLVAAAMVLSGCISIGGEIDENTTPDDGMTKDVHESSFDRPLPDVITGLLPVAESDVPSGSGFTIHGDYAYVGGLGTGFHIVNVTDPANPALVSSISGDETYARDADILTYADGRIVAVLASQGGGMNFVDVTNPEDPVHLSNVETAAIDSPTHNVAVLPGTHLVFNSASGGKGGDIDIIDAQDPTNPEIVESWGTHGCHDITFYMNDAEEKYRAYCAGIEETQIWDITDPLDGKLVASVTNEWISPGGHLTGDRSAADQGLHHLAMVNEDASLLIVGDEYHGGRDNGCGVQVPGGPDSPLGAIWFYDITDEANPEYVGHFSPTVPVEELVARAPDQGADVTGETSCTSHFGQVIPGHDVFAISWYRAGVLLVDFSDPTEPTLIDQWNPNTNVWEVRYHNGYLFTGDMYRGLDVLTLE